MRTIWGFGGIKISLNADMSDAVYFDHSVGQLKFMQIFNEFTTASRVQRRIFKGWRPVITTTLRNVGCQLTGGYDYEVMQSFLAMINQARNTDVGFYVQPRYDTSFPIQMTFLCEFTSDVDIPDGADANVFQTMDIEFVGKSPEPQIPTVLSNSEASLWIDETGDFYVDETGDYYTMTN